LLKEKNITDYLSSRIERYNQLGVFRET